MRRPYRSMFNRRSNISVKHAKGEGGIAMDVPVEIVKGKIYLLRGQKVLLDADLAQLYGVETANLNKAVKRNLDRFPADFMFQLTAEEAGSLRFQIGISKPQGRGGRRYLPYAFTEKGLPCSPACEQRPCRAGQHRHHARLRATARAGRLDPGAGSSARRSGKEGRRP